MKFVIAPDKFKGSLTGLQFCKIVKESLEKLLQDAEILALPLADGGDGTVDVLEYNLKSKRIKVNVKDPLFRSINASYLYIDSIKTAFIEMAVASGMALLKPYEQNCFYTTSLGTGEIIKDAIEKGAKTIILGIGGSATNDCGIGMAKALGYKFEDEDGYELSPIGSNLSKIHFINSDNVPEILKHIKFKVACDVNNPLFGENGAAFIYGPQKGASKEEIVVLDEGLKHISNIFLRHFKKDVQNIEGAGAAGGMGAGAMVFLDAELQSGISLVKDLIDFDEKIKNADWIITGEGRLDSQTLSGKTIHGVLKSASQNKIPVAALCGISTLSKEKANSLGISYLDSIVNEAENLEDAIANAEYYLSKMATKFAKSIMG
ncbi:glycerate kinase [Confluentibacter lentus]|uniref:glycerate kinase n=1 Tax=Confluentibacter lentus TaxID=1699412 RepID=UPI000C28C7E1|nr:glycerate kinase [Confluentibacter lentus]